MKIALSSMGQTLNSHLDRRFERCPYFIIIDTETKNFESVLNSGSVRKDGTSSSALNIVLSNGVEAVITGDMRSGAFQILSNANKKIITGVSGRIKNIVEEFRINEIQKCPSCHSENLIRDYEKMIIKCENCGLETLVKM